MALTQCPDCSREVSDQAESCIHCGCPLRALPPLSQRAVEDSVKRGSQRSALAGGVGNGVALIAICAAVVLGMAGAGTAALWVLVLGVAFGVWIAYFS